MSALFYNAARSARALQHGRHAEGAVHRLPDRGAGALLGHGARARARSSPTAAAGTTPISGLGDAATCARAFGDGTYQALRNDFHRNARDNLLVELGKHGLGKRDVVANVNFFVRVGVDEAGRLGWVAGNSRAGAAVELRFEMDTLVVLSNTPHPLDPRRRYGPPPVELAISDGPPAGADDPCRLSRPENGRGFALTEAYLREIGEDDGVTREPAGEHRSIRDARPSTSRCRPGEGWTHELAPRRQSSASSISKATRRSTRCSSTRAISTSATARPTPSARRGTST